MGAPFSTDSNVTSFRELCLEQITVCNLPLEVVYGTHKTLKKLEENGSIAEIVRLVHNHFARSTSSIAAISRYVTEDPKKTSDLDLHLHPYTNTEASGQFTMPYRRRLGTWTTSSGRRNFEKIFLQLKNSLVQWRHTTRANMGLL